MTLRAPNGGFGLLCLLLLACEGAGEDTGGDSENPAPIGNTTVLGDLVTGRMDAAVPGPSAEAGPDEPQWPSCGDDFDDEDGGVTPYENECAIDERFGVFVNGALESDDGADGSRARPFASLVAAIAQAVHDEKHVYACEGVYSESMRIGTDLTDGLQVYGGLSCETFTVESATARSTVRVTGSGPALLVADTRLVTIERFDFEHVAGAFLPGASFTAASIRNARLITLRDVTLRAAPGEDGEDGEMLSGAAGNGLPGLDGAAACTANPNRGGLAVSSDACNTQNTTSGAGGDGGIGTGNGGMGFNFGFPQVAGEFDATWSCIQGSGLGFPAQVGFAGQPGRGGRGFGALLGSGFIGYGGSPGFDGGPGGGGAGGGGARAPASCPGLASPTGASAGSGGSGGCGGEGGAGGEAGGSSIGLLSLNARVSLENVRIEYGDGGDGGDGAQGQPGGTGGVAGKGGAGTGGSRAACDGRDGGNGGVGGPGGGGNGGHAIGILYAGEAPHVVGVGGIMEAQARVGGAPGVGPAGVMPPLDVQLTGTPGTSAFMVEF